MLRQPTSARDDSAFRSSFRLLTDHVYLDPPKFSKVAYVTGGLRLLYSRVHLTQTEGKEEQHSKAGTTNGRRDVKPEKYHPVPGAVLARRYQTLHPLSQSGQSAVLFHAKDLFRGGLVVVVKAMHRSYYQLGIQETQCLCSLRHADPKHTAPTVKLLSTFEEDGHFCLVFEALHPVPITDAIPRAVPSTKNQTVSQIRTVAARLVQVLGFLGRQHLIHADLKPCNILLEREGDLSSLKVIDFGNTIRRYFKEISLYFTDFNIQPLLYRAPEAMFGMCFDREIDMWSLGCILAELYLGRGLFCGHTKNEILVSMTHLLGPLPQEPFLKGKYFHSLKHFTADTEQKDATFSLMEALQFCTDFSFASFLAGLLRYNPAERLTPLQAASHPFLQVMMPPTETTPDLGRIELTAAQYPHRPTIAANVLQQQLTPWELLRHGTRAESAFTPVRDSGHSDLAGPHLKSSPPSCVCACGRSQSAVQAAKQDVRFQGMEVPVQVIFSSPPQCHGTGTSASDERGASRARKNQSSQSKSCVTHAGEKSSFPPRTLDQHSQPMSSSLQSSGCSQELKTEMDRKSEEESEEEEEQAEVHQYTQPMSSMQSPGSSQDLKTEMERKREENKEEEQAEVGQHSQPMSSSMKSPGSSQDLKTEMYRKWEENEEEEEEEQAEVPEDMETEENELSGRGQERAYASGRPRLSPDTPLCMQRTQSFPKESQRSDLWNSLEDDGSKSASPQRTLGRLSHSTSTPSQSPGDSHAFEVETNREEGQEEEREEDEDQMEGLEEEDKETKSSGWHQRKGEANRDLELFSGGAACKSEAQSPTKDMREDQLQSKHSSPQDNWEVGDGQEDSAGASDPENASSVCGGTSLGEESCASMAEADAGNVLEGERTSDESDSTIFTEEVKLETVPPRNLAAGHGPPQLMLDRETGSVPSADIKHQCSSHCVPTDGIHRHDALVAVETRVHGKAALTTFEGMNEFKDRSTFNDQRLFSHQNHSVSQSVQTSDGTCLQRKSGCDIDSCDGTPCSARVEGKVSIEKSERMKTIRGHDLAQEKHSDVEASQAKRPKICRTRVEGHFTPANGLHLEELDRVHSLATQGLKVEKSSTSFDTRRRLSDCSGGETSFESIEENPKLETQRISRKICRGHCESKPSDTSRSLLDCSGGARSLESVEENPKPEMLRISRESCGGQGDSKPRGFFSMLAADGATGKVTVPRMAACSQPRMKAIRSSEPEVTMSGPGLAGESPALRKGSGNSRHRPDLHSGGLAPALLTASSQVPHGVECKTSNTSDLNDEGDHVKSSDDDDDVELLLLEED